MGASGIQVMATVAVRPAFEELVPRFQQQGGATVIPLWIPTVQMMQRLKGGEVVDIVLLTAAMIDELTDDGVIAPGSRVDIVKSRVGMAVRAGARKPDVRSVAAFKQAMLAAQSIGYSTGPSGIYIAQLFQRLGIAEAVKDRVRVVTGVPVGKLIADGNVEIGFQQVSELMPVAGIERLGSLPQEIECVTTFSAGVHRKAPQAEGARDFIRYLTSADAAPVMRDTGLEPLTAA